MTLIQKIEEAKIRAQKAISNLKKLELEYDRLVKIPELRGLVGKFFKYPRNSYSYAKKDSDYWPVYVKVTGIDAENFLNITSFETDSRGKFIYWNTKWFYGIAKGFVPCSEKEYLDAFRKQVARLSP